MVKYCYHNLDLRAIAKQAHVELTRTAACNLLWICEAAFKHVKTSEISRICSVGGCMQQGIASRAFPISVAHLHALMIARAALCPDTLDGLFFEHLARKGGMRAV